MGSWTEAKGGLWFYDLAQHAIYTIARGRISGAQAESLRSRADFVFDRTPKTWAVHDWGDVDGYESRARTVMTDWSLARRSRLAGCVILTGSKLVAMGVSAASVPLTFAGISVQAFTDRAAFEARAVEVLTRRPA